MKPIIQRDSYGCGAACIAFILKEDYSEVVSVLGKRKVENSGFYCKDLVKVLSKFGLGYSYKYLKPKLKRKIYKNEGIVFIKRSKKYPTGHYLAYSNGQWMDPWINFSRNKNVVKAKAGFRKKLPGTPIYALFPEEK